MSRPAKPFAHQGHYYTSIGGKQRRLCRIEDGIERAREELRKLQSETFHTGQIAPDLSVAEAAALFLREVETDKGEQHRTFQCYRSKLQRLVDRLGSRKLRSLSKIDGSEYKRWLKEVARTRPTGRRKGQKTGKTKPSRPLGTVSVNRHLTVAKMLLNWAVEGDFLLKNPWKGKKKVRVDPEQGRERILTDEEFALLLKHCDDTDFQDVLRVLRLTAARPEDLCHLKWGMVAWELHCWVIPPYMHKTGNTQKTPQDRIIGMVPEVEEILRRRQQGGTGEFVFTNTRKLPWTSNSLGRRFRTLRVKAGIVMKDGENVVLYSNRHTRLTELAWEMPLLALVKVGGWTTPAMASRYVHPADQAVIERLRETQARIDARKEGGAK